MGRVEICRYDRWSGMDQLKGEVDGDRTYGPAATEILVYPLSEVDRRAGGGEENLRKAASLV